MKAPTVSRAHPAGTAPHGTVPWTPEDMAVAWAPIPDYVQSVLGVLAAYPQGIHITKLSRICNDYPPGMIRGILNQSNRVHKKYPRRPRLYNYDRRSRAYWIDEATAELIRQQPNPWCPLHASDDENVSSTSRSEQP